jgi:riboflavin kinase/FMN adenylyltransferase
VAAELNFRYASLPAYKSGDMVVSSTKIRRLLEDGHVAEAKAALGRAYAFDAVVVRGDGRGKGMGFPTANLECVSRDKLLPGDGVYAVYVHHGGERFAGMMNIGARPTFGKSSRTVEVHLIDFKADIYNQRIRICLVDRIRSEHRFESSDALIVQLQRDRTTCMSILKSKKEAQCP